MLKIVISYEDDLKSGYPSLGSKIVWVDFHIGVLSTLSDLSPLSTRFGNHNSNRSKIVYKISN